MQGVRDPAGFASRIVVQTDLAPNESGQGTNPFRSVPSLRPLVRLAPGERKLPVAHSESDQIGFKQAHTGEEPEQSGEPPRITAFHRGERGGDQQTAPSERGEKED